MFWRFCRTWITHNHAIYYTGVILSGIGLYQMWYYIIIGEYRRRNAHCSLEAAIEAEKEWDKIKPKDDDDDEDEEEEE